MLKKLNVGIVTGEMNRDSDRDRDMGRRADKDIALTIGTSRVRVALRAQWTPRGFDGLLRRTLKSQEIILAERQGIVISIK